MTDTEIRPALTAEEWDDAIASMCEGIIYVDGEPRVGRTLLSLPGAIALANHFLPDDDPRKITRADVDMLTPAMVDDGWADEYIPLVEALAAKLAALLPPEGA